MSSAATTRSLATPVKTATIVLAFGSVYFFWGSTFTAIRIGASEMPALLLAGPRFLIAGALLLAWCRWRGLNLLWPRRTLVLAVIPLYVALIEMFLPGGEPLPAKGWLGLGLGFSGLAALLWPSLRNG